MYLKMSDLNFIPRYLLYYAQKKSAFCCPNPQLLLPSPCPHLHLHSTHSPSFFSKHPCDLSFSWSFMIREIFLYLSEMWFSQLSLLRFDNFGSHHFWSHPWEIKNQCIVGDVVWHLDKPMKQCFFCCFFEMSVVLSLQSREPSPTITNPPKKMIYIFFFFFSRNQWNCLRPFNNWGWYTIIWTKNRTPKQDGNRVLKLPCVALCCIMFHDQGCRDGTGGKDERKQKLWRDG